MSRTNFVKEIAPPPTAPVLVERGSRFRRLDASGVEREYILAKTKRGPWNLVDLANGMSWCGTNITACYDTIEEILVRMNEDARGFRLLYDAGAISGVWTEVTA